MPSSAFFAEPSLIPTFVESNITVHTHTRLISLTSDLVQNAKTAITTMDKYFNNKFKIMPL